MSRPLEPPPSKVKEFETQWKRWLFNLFTHVKELFTRVESLETSTLWVLFDGVTATIIAGNGISSVLRLAQGRYSLVFTNPMNNANYATFINVNEAEAAVSVGGAVTDLSETVTGVDIFTTTVSSATSQYKDFNRVSVSIIGGTV